jgi:hypothetical protein
LWSCCLTSLEGASWRFHRFQKQNLKTRKQVSAREVRPPANFVDYIPLTPPYCAMKQLKLIPLHQFWRCSIRGAKLVNAAALPDFFT